MQTRPDSLVQGIRRAIQELEPIAARAPTDAALQAMFHPDTFVSQLLELADEKGKPHRDFLSLDRTAPMDRGSAWRVVPLVRLLGALSNRCTFFRPDGSAREPWKRGVLVLGPAALERVLSSLRSRSSTAHFTALSRARHPARAKTIVGTTQRRLPGLAREARRIVSSSSAVLLEYPFSEKTVLSSCAEEQ